MDGGDAGRKVKLKGPGRRVGKVDARLDDWFAAHEKAHPGEVKRIDVIGTPWFAGEKWVQVDMPWSGPWL
jgi:hypothetical protein